MKSRIIKIGLLVLCLIPMILASDWYTDIPVLSSFKQTHIFLLAHSNLTYTYSVFMISLHGIISWLLFRKNDVENGIQLSELSEEYTKSSTALTEKAAELSKEITYTQVELGKFQHNIDKDIKNRLTEIKQMKGYIDDSYTKMKRMHFKRIEKLYKILLDTPLTKLQNIHQYAEEFLKQENK